VTIISSIPNGAITAACVIFASLSEEDDVYINNQIIKI